MSDPLSITTGIIGVLEAVKGLYNLIQDIQDAPDNVKKAAEDLKATEGILEHLNKYVRASSSPSAVQTLLDHKSALATILLQSQRLCDDLRSKLARCVGSKMSWTDRVISGLRKGAIDKFRMELARNRQLLAMRVDMIGLLTSEQNLSAAHNFYQANNDALKAIAQDLEKVEIAMAQVNDICDGSAEMIEQSLQAQEAALKEQLRLCEENREELQRQHFYKQEFGNTEAGDDSKNFQGLDLDKARGRIEQKYGDTTIGTRSWNFQGASGGDMMASFFHGPIGTPKVVQKSCFIGTGKRLGGIGDL